MRERPPASLVEFLARLGLAQPRQVHAVASRARRLARELPLFESVWVDALAQARVLTPFQASEINAGRGDDLAVGPWVLCEPWGRRPFARLFRARHRQSGEAVFLAICEDCGAEAESLAGRIKDLAACAAELAHPAVAAVRDGGADRGRVWAAGPWTGGRTAGKWVVHNGRFPPEVVLEIARQMADGLAALEQAGLSHGDLAAPALVLDDEGQVVMPLPGLRGVLRPCEGLAQAGTDPEALEGVAPERIAEGGPPGARSDIYACGWLWWHLLTGRPPVPGPTALARVRAIQTCRVQDVRSLAPETPSELGAVVSAAMERDPARRPAAFAAMAARLGPPTLGGQAALARCLRDPHRRRSVWSVPARRLRHSPQAPLWLAGTAAVIVGAIALGWLIRTSGVRPPTASIRGRSTVAASAKRIDSSRRDHPDRQPRRDAGVPAPALETDDRPASRASTVEPPSRAASRPTPPSPSEPAGPPPDLILPAGKPVHVEALDLRPGQRVCGPPGERPTVIVPPAGLTIRAEDVRLEGIDFLGQRGRGESGLGPGGAILVLEGSRAALARCAFRAVGAAGAPPAALRWVHPVDRRAAEMTLPSGRIDLADCAFTGVSAAVDCRTLGARAVRMVNVLHLGPGPLVRMERCPEADEPIALSLAAVTVRGGAAVARISYDRFGRQPGRILIDARDCVLDPAADGGLLVFEGPQSPQPLLAIVQWTGQGSLIGPETPVAVWLESTGRGTALDDAEMAIAGMARSRLQFAGPVGQGLAASRLDRWQGPSRSAGPPGVNPQRLSLRAGPGGRAAAPDAGGG